MQQQITIEMIESKEFKTKARGYDQHDVDTFLDDICDEMSRLLDTISVLQSQVESLSATRAADTGAAPVVTPAPVEQQAIPTQEITEVLEAAVRFKQMIEKEARDKAATIVAEAEKTASTMLSEAQTQADARLSTLNEEHTRLSTQVENLKKAAVDYREKFQAMIQQQQEALANAIDLF